MTDPAMSTAEPSAASPELPDPQPILQAMTAFWGSGALRGALRLDVFTHVGRGSRTVEALADALGAHPRGVRMLADAMCSLGFLAKEADGYTLSPVAAAYLTSDSPTFVGDFHRFVTSEPFWAAWHRVDEAVRTGAPVVDRNGLAEDHELWTIFAQTSLPMALGTTMPAVERLGSAPDLRILDVAAGSGGYGIALALTSPGSTLTFLDWPNVLAVTKTHALQMGLDEDQVELRPGNALEIDWGGPYDRIVAGNFLHHFDRETCVEIARKAHRALTPAGVFATAEFIADERREASTMPLLFALTMLVWTEGGDAYTAAELEGMLLEAGFDRAEHQRFGDNPSSWVVGLKG